MLRRVGDILTKRKEELADLMTREMGKPLTETRGDVQEGIDTAYYAATVGRQLAGRTVPSEMENKWAMSFRRPIGVAGIIAPFNFPLAIPTWKLFPALVCGNACVFKPSEDVPHTGHTLVEIMLEAGLPPEVIQLVHGIGPDVGAPIVDSFTGSTATGSIVGETCGRMHKRLSLEMGGKNAQIVMDDADLDLALDGVLWGAFGTTGQRCTATSRLILQSRIHDRFLGARRWRATSTSGRPTAPISCAAAGGPRGRATSTDSSSSPPSSRGSREECASNRRRSSVRCSASSGWTTPTRPPSASRAAMLTLHWGIAQR